MSLFRSTSVRSTLQDMQAGRHRSNSGTTGPAPLRPADEAKRSPPMEQLPTNDPTYYDVLKCRGEFATPSAFFSRALKPVHPSDKTFPWASRSEVVGGEKVGNKHKLRRAVPSSADAAASQQGESTMASSSVFPSQADSSLPPSVFRLPSTRTAVGAAQKEPWALSGMTSGGRALRRADQATLSRYDRKVALV